MENEWSLVYSWIGALIIGIVLLIIEHRTRWFAHRFQFLHSSISSYDEVFIIYSEQVEQDKELKSYLEETFNKYDIRVFPELRIGDDPGVVFPKQIQTCKYILILLSEQSLQDEFFLGLVEISCSIKAKILRKGSPRILPVRVSYHEEVPDFIPYLKHIKAFEWQSLKDNKKLASELLKIINGEDIIISDTVTVGGHIPQGKFPTDNLLSPSSAPRPDINIGESQGFYIKRGEVDNSFVRILLTPGSIATIRGAHQMGMTSLLKYGVESINEPRYVVWINFKPLTYDANLDLNTLLYSFAHKITLELRLDQNDLETIWSEDSLSIRKLDKYITNFIFQYSQETETPIILILDDVDTIQKYPFSSEFFGMIRGLHQAGTPQSHPCQKLTIAMAISTEPYNLIQEVISPFNLGHKIRLRDFNEAEVARLNQRYENVLNGVELSYLYSLLNGHPYLTQQAFYSIRANHYTWAEFRKIVLIEDGPFYSHLQRYLLLLQRNPDLRKTMKRVLDGQTHSNKELCQRLEKAGLLRMDENDTSYYARCQLYYEFFTERL